MIELQAEITSNTADEACRPLNLGYAQRKVGCRGVLSKALQDRYRCPENFVEVALGGPSSGEPGYFSFGPDLICYGRCLSVRQTTLLSGTYDAFDDIEFRSQTVVLPFNPDEITDNLRLERNGPKPGVDGLLREILRRAYYRIRPLTTASIRAWVQRFHSRNWPKQTFPKWPVDTSVEDLSERLLALCLRAKGMDRVPFVWFWPQGASGCVTMTHDVETEAGRNFCLALADIDSQFGIRASFQIVPEGRYTVSAAFLSAIRQRGFEIGIQDLNHDGRLFDSEEEFRRRAEQINRYGREYNARGFRAGVLYRKPEWYDALDFSYDMSIPNVAHLDPQPGGCCTVMPYFIGSILEIPVTTVQDYTLFHILRERSIDLWKNQLELILAKSGVASFIVHPDYVADAESCSIYVELLKYLQELRCRRDVWLALPGEIDQWWRARSKMSLVETERGWKIVGADSARAVLAFARNVDGKIVYELEKEP